ncbi:MAG: T9SS type A sorting domain-containing protein [Bacteroidia bacterium]|nr:T9SS type A sorting domain-containing protein [Bacteroidia bacterium]
MRKFIILIVIANGLAGLAFGQGFLRMNFTQPAALTATAGHDTLVCSNHPVVLGGNPSATGGNSSYVYLWLPTDGLNDQTSSNPTAILSETKTYTLTVTDGNGCMAISSVKVQIDECLGTNEQQLNQVITVFPNPSDGTFTISGLSSLNSQLQKIEVLNHLGQSLLTRDYKPGDLVSDLVLETNIKEPGVYFLKTTLSNRVVTQRLIVR